MPSNTVKINNSDDFEWAVGDSKMGELIKWLEEKGERLREQTPPEKPTFEAGTEKVEKG